MNFRYIIVAIGLGILGFLFYPRGEEVVSLSDSYFIKPVRILKNEESHYSSIRRSNPLVNTFDLGYVYKFNQAIVPFQEPIENGPKRYSILVSHSRENGYISAHDYVAGSPEYTIPIQRFPNPVEGRWIQVIVDDWFSKEPNLKTDEFRVGIQYKNPSPVRSISSKYNRENLDKLVDLIVSEDSKWTAAERITEEIEEEGKKRQEVSFNSPGDDITVTFDLEDVIPIYGTRLTTDGPGNNLKRYQISVSIDGNEYTSVYVSPELEDKTVEDVFNSSKEINTRYVRLEIDEGEWYGDYAEIQEIEFFTENHKLYQEELPDINQYNAVQVYYDDCGYDNRRSPNLVQGFSFDRGTYDENRYFYPQEELNPGNTDAQRSFCYHYNKIIFRYTNLSDDSFYWVKVTYLQPKNGNRIQSLDVDGYILHGSEVEIPKGKAKTYTFPIPKQAYADGAFELRFRRLAGVNAVVSEVGIFEARPQTEEVVRRTISRAVQVSTPVKVDGSLEEWPKLYPLIPSGIHAKTEELPAKVYLQWDKDNLYLGAEVNRTAMKSQDGENLGSREIANLLGRLNVFVDTIASRSPGIYKINDHHLLFFGGSHRFKRFSRVAQIHHHLDAISANIPRREEVEYVQDFTETGYTIEARIPGNEVLKEFNPQIGKTIGFNYILSNRLTDNIGWSTDVIDAPPSQWGTVELVSKISGQIVVMDEKSKEQIDSFDSGDSLIVSVWDAERNAERDKIETVSLEISGNITSDYEKLTLTESEPISYQNVPNSGLFAFKLPTEYNTEPVEGDGVLQVVGNEVITLTYFDPYYVPDQKQKELNINLKVNVGAEGEVVIMREDECDLDMGADGEVFIMKESGKQIEQFRTGEKLIFEIRDADLLEYVKKARQKTQNPEQEAKEEDSTEKNPENDKAVEQSEKQEDVFPEIEIELRVPDTDEVERIPTMPVIEERKEECSGIYAGSVKTEYSTEPIPLDGVLQIAGAQKLVVTYIDEIQSTGQTDVKVTTQAKVEVGDTGILSIVPGEGIIMQDGIKFNAGTKLQLRLKDRDLNKDSSKVDTVEIEANGNMLNDKLNIVLQETDKSTGEFAGICQTKYATEANTGNDLLEVKGNEVLTFTYIDVLQGTGATNVAVQIKAKVNVGEDGILTIVRRAGTLVDVDKFNAGDVLYFSLQDADESDKVEITIVGNQNNDKETVELYQTTSTSDIFIGSIKTEYSEKSNSDGVLQVRGKEKVIAVYIDKLRSTGETNVSVSDSAVVNTGYTGTLTVYKKGTIREPIEKFRAGETLVLEVEDLDLSRTGAVSEQLEIDSSTDIGMDTLRISVREVSGNAGVFRGEIQTEYSEKANPNDTLLQVQGLGVVTFTYEDVLQKTGRTQVPISVQLAVETGERGNLEVYDADGKELIASADVGIGSFSAGDTLTVRLSDNDVNIDNRVQDSVQVNVTGNRLGDELPVRLLETGNNSGIFEGKLFTEYSDSYNITDDILQVTDKEFVSVKYIDKIVNTGETNVLIQAQAIVLSSSPGVLYIVDEYDQELGSFNAGRTIYLWLQDLLLSTVDSTVKPTVTVSGDKTNDFVTVTLDRVLGEEGVFRGSVPTSYGTTSVDDNTLDVQGDEKITATYQPDFPGVYSLGVQDTTYVNSGTRGKILIVKNDGTPVYNFNPGTTLYFRLEDIDLNKEPFSVDYADIWVSASAEGVGNYVTLTEEGRNSGIFVGSLKTQRGRSGQDVDVLGLVGGEIVRAIYIDEIVDTGETNVEITDTCRANSIGWATYADEKIIIDGIEDKWPLETALETEQSEGLVWVQWDRNNLYILAQIYDDEVVVTDATEWYEGGTDAIELHIDLNPDEAEKPSYLRKGDEEKEFVFWICPKGGGVEGIQPYAGRYKPTEQPNYSPIKIGVKYHLEASTPYYIIEAAIPFSPALEGFDPLKTIRNDKIGFNYVIYRSNAPIVRWAKPAEGSDEVPLSKLGTLFLERPLQ